MSVKPRPVKVVRKPYKFLSDNTRVIARPFQSPRPDGGLRSGMIKRVLDLPEEDVCSLVAEVREEYSHRHRDFEELLERHFDVEPEGPLLRVLRAKPDAATGAPRKARGKRTCSTFTRLEVQDAP